MKTYERPRGKMQGKIHDTECFSSPQLDVIANKTRIFSSGSPKQNVLDK